VSADLLNGWSHIAVIAEKADDEVLEVVAEASAVHLGEVGVDLTLE
jgi:hypothetical protein